MTAETALLEQLAAANQRAERALVDTVIQVIETGDTSTFFGIALRLQKIGGGNLPEAERVTAAAQAFEITRLGSGAVATIDTLVPLAFAIKPELLVLSLRQGWVDAHQSILQLSERGLQPPLAELFTSDQEMFTNASPSDMKEIIRIVRGTPGMQCVIDCVQKLSALANAPDRWRQLRVPEKHIPYMGYVTAMTTRSIVRSFASTKGLAAELKAKDAERALSLAVIAQKQAGSRTQ